MPVLRANVIRLHRQFRRIVMDEDRHKAPSHLHISPRPYMEYDTFQNSLNWLPLVFTLMYNDGELASHADACKML